MGFKIGFTAETEHEEKRNLKNVPVQKETPIIKKSVVEVFFPDRQRDFVLSISESDLVLIKEMSPNYDNPELFAIAENIESAMNKELGIKTVIGIGTTVNSLKDLARSFKEAQTALEVGKVFETEKNIISFDAGVTIWDNTDSNISIE